MAVGDAYVFPGFLTPVLTQLFFPKPPTTFLTCFYKGERRKYAIFDYLYTRASANIDQSVPKLATIYMPMRSWMGLIMGQIEPEHSKLFALEFEKKNAEYDFVNTLSSTNIDQSAPNMVKMYATIRSAISSIIDLIGLELFELSALELEKLPYLTLFTL